MEFKEIIFIFIHFAPIFLEAFAIFPTIYLLIKIKYLPYRCFLVVKYCIIILLMVLTIEDLNLVILNGILSPVKIGGWELSGFLVIICFIANDVFAYIFYSHKKIVISNTKGNFFKIIAFLAKDPKIWRSTLKLIGVIFISILIFIVIFYEIASREQSQILGLIKEYFKN